MTRQAARAVARRFRTHGPVVAAFATVSISLPGSGLSETAVHSGKSDRQIIVAMASRSDITNVTDWASARPTSGTAVQPLQPSADTFRAAFGLFESKTDGTPDDGVRLRSASIDPVSLDLGTQVQAPATSNATGLSSAIGALPGTAAKHPEPVTALPLPRAKPPVPKPVQVASLGATDLPTAEPKRTVLDTAPILGEPRRVPGGATPYLEIFRREAKAHNIPLWLALGVAWVESKFDPKLRGTHTVVGMMQVMPSTAREMGYRGTTNQLFDPETNIIWGMKELAKDYQIAKGDICLTIAKYKGGFHTNHINKGASNYCAQVKHVTGMP